MCHQPVCRNMCNKDYQPASRDEIYKLIESINATELKEMILKNVHSESFTNNVYNFFLDTAIKQ